MNHNRPMNAMKNEFSSYTSSQPMSLLPNHSDTRKASLFAVLLLVLSCFSGCHSRQIRIAIIPQTTGTSLWNPLLDGAQSIVRGRNVSLYWNAPTSEDNIKAQISLLEQIIHSGQYSGIVLAPDHALALMDAVQDAEAAGIPVVIVSSRLSLPPSHDLSYILNSDVLGGRWAAKYLGKLLHGHGSVAIIGIDPAILGNIQRERSFEAVLHKSYPGISVVARRFGAYNIPHQTQVAATLLKHYPSISAIIALNPAAERGIWNALLTKNETSQVKVIGFDQDVVVDGEQQIRINAIVEQNTYRMGQLAVQQILDDIHDRRVAPVTLLPPIFVTRNPSPLTPAVKSSHKSRPS